MRIVRTERMRTEWHLGIGTDSTGRTILMDDRARIKTHLMRIVSAAFGGATILEHKGAWTTPDGKLVIEDGLTIIAYGPSSPDPMTLSQVILEVAHQSAIIMSLMGREGQFVYEVARD